jgi:hypothetical protein
MLRSFYEVTQKSMKWYPSLNNQDLQSHIQQQFRTGSTIVFLHPESNPHLQPHTIITKVWCLIADVSEHCVCFIFIGEWIWSVWNFQNTTKAWNQE